MARRRGSQSFRIGKVRGDLRGSVWYLTYHEEGQRRRPRVGPDESVARRMAAEVNAQLQGDVPTVFGFEPVAIDELQRRWLDHHEHVLRSAVRTIVRYRCATRHLVDFVASRSRATTVDRFTVSDAEAFARHLRTIRVAPNGHPNSRKRPLLDKGVKYVLQTCRSLFAFAIKRRHLSPYAENPFAALDLDRIPVENARPIVLLTQDEERRFFEACDHWQFPVFATLMLTGLRPGELVHLLLPNDLDLDEGAVRVRNKPRLGWQVKTRNEREVPLVGVLVSLLRTVVGTRRHGPVFLRRPFAMDSPPLVGSEAELEAEIARRTAVHEGDSGTPMSRSDSQAVMRAIWRDAGALRTDKIRREFMALTKAVGLPHVTAPKTLRHQFATSLQEANVDPLIRCELMGHSVEAAGSHGLGMTAVYTHTRPETRRAEIERALAARSGLQLLIQRRTGVASLTPR